MNKEIRLSLVERHFNYGGVKNNNIRRVKAILITLTQLSLSLQRKEEKGQIL